MTTARLYCGDARAIPLPDESVHCVVTSPPYWGLRSYKLAPSIWDGAAECEHEWAIERLVRRHKEGETNPGKEHYTKNAGAWSESGGQFCQRCPAWRGCLGLEPTPDLYLVHLVQIFREVRRTLRPDGTLWLNIGDSYAGSGSPGGDFRDGKGGDEYLRPYNHKGTGLKAGDLVGIPWRLALALQADGWWLRSDVIWCLSGGTWLYARTQKGDMPMMARDMARLDPSTVSLWNGAKWTRLLGMSRHKRTATELELVLRSGERIACTPAHRFPTARGLLDAKDIGVGDCLVRVRLAEPERPLDTEHMSKDAAWFAGLYIAEGSRFRQHISIAGHTKETARWEQIKRIAESYGGSATVTVKGHVQTVRVYGKMLNALLDHLVTGHDAWDKGFAPIAWRYSNQFIAAILQGYLDGDGHWDASNQRWRLGFCRNYNLERDLRTACARLGVHLVLNMAHVKYNGTLRPTFRGEIRFEQSDHWNEKDVNEVVAIRKARSRFVYDLGVADEPHVFALASGVLTHNSKPAPMPESVNGWRWQKHRVRLAPSARAGLDSVHTLAHDGLRPPQGARDGREFASHANEYTNCPGCPQCAPNDGLVLRKGSWRPTTAHEYIFQFTKTASYYGDREAVAEALSLATLADGRNATGRHTQGDVEGSKFNTEDAYDMPSWYRAKTFVNPANGRNRRSVWAIGPEPFPGSHFATFPTELPTICIKASTSEKGVCAKCGAPWARILSETSYSPTRPSAGHDPRSRNSDRLAEARGSGGWRGNNMLRDAPNTLSWRPTCQCAAGDPVPATVLDPFIGSGSTAIAALRLGRDCVGIDLSMEYIGIAEARIKKDAPLMNTVETADAQA